MSHRRGWQERHISCIGPGNAVANDLHCIHKPKPIKRRKCTHKDCEVMWRASAWSAVSYGGLTDVESCCAKDTWVSYYPESIRSIHILCQELILHLLFLITLTSFLGQRGPTPLFINQHQNGKFECERTLTRRKKKSGIGPYISCGKLTLLAFLSFWSATQQFEKQMLHVVLVD